MIKWIINKTFILKVPLNRHLEVFDSNVFLGGARRRVNDRNRATVSASAAVSPVRKKIRGSAQPKILGSEQKFRFQYRNLPDTENTIYSVFCFVVCFFIYNFKVFSDISYLLKIIFSVWGHAFESRSTKEFSLSRIQFCGNFSFVAVFSLPREIENVTKKTGFQQLKKNWMKKIIFAATLRRSTCATFCGQNFKLCFNWKVIKSGKFTLILW